MFYKFLKISIGSAVRIFFRKIVVSGAENIPSDKPVIFVSNHPSAFMDPLILGSLTERELYFFARADIFTSGFINWITKKAHMSPIYRSVDGLDSLEKNDVVFSHGYKLLCEKKVLLLFGEGVTDEEFVRRVKNMKKGSMRIAFGAENKYNFKLDVNIVCVGINYSDPRKFRSDLLINFSKPIEVSQYKELFFEHNNKAMLALNKEIYSRLKEQIIHIENPEYAEFFEQMLIITRKGINNDYHDKNIALGKRWKYSKRLANGLNKKAVEAPDEIKILKERTSEYFNSLYRQHNATGQNNAALAAFLIVAFPLFIFGIFNNYPPVKLSYFLSRKISKRPVFWSGTDMVFSIITVPVYYLIFILLLHKYSILNTEYSIPFLISMPFSGIFAFNYFQKLNSFWKTVKLGKIIKDKKEVFGKIEEMRISILKDIEKILFQ